MVVAASTKALSEAESDSVKKTAADFRTASRALSLRFVERGNRELAGDAIDLVNGGLPFRTHLRLPLSRAAKNAEMRKE